MKKVLLAALPLLLLPGPSAQGAVAQETVECQAARLYVVYEASEGFALAGTAADRLAIRTTVTCTLVRFGTTEVARTSGDCVGSACATAKVVQTPYGGMSLCTVATFEYADGRVRTVRKPCELVPAP